MYSTTVIPWQFEIPLKSGRCCKKRQSRGREVCFCLNPFEVREVLQANMESEVSTPSVSIPLKSGRCCKTRWEQAPIGVEGLNPFEVREVLQVHIHLNVSYFYPSQSL